MLNPSRNLFPEVMLCSNLTRYQLYFLLVAAAGIAGHIYPVYHGFKGGRGESPMMGAMLIINWFGIPIANFSSLILGYLTGSVLVIR